MLSPLWHLFCHLEAAMLMQRAAQIAAGFRRLGGPLAETVARWQAEGRRCHERARYWLRRWAEENDHAAGILRIRATH
ncbi:MAG: hypothetical protein HS117_19365 [Verrucomicrobiaceae bacterium]|nr:hypothetical protein [Verrucomicrobiaceae bacterium]